MDYGIVPEPPPYHDHPLLRRRSSASAVAQLALLSDHNSSTSTSTTTTSAAATSSSSSFPSDDLDLLSIKPASHSYTSIRDLLPAAAVNSPKPGPALMTPPGSDICIRNRLVKQAAWAYLQPMSTSPGSSGGGFLRRLWPRAAEFIDFVRRGLARAVSWAFRVLWIRSSR
ncbi:Unknown protein [Striga hermonthica]|uniref:Uncharacterized protein n=1 Tax=Striga hermonthica TaxID=68872 RepID=A0A9N7MY89_STRHE|nr:Unknown protein [Striga hermonthica]